MRHPEEALQRTTTPNGSGTLFEIAGFQIVDFGGGPVALTPEGQSIFAAHLRMARACNLSACFGQLALERARDGLTEPVTIFEVRADMLDDEDGWTAYQAVRRTPDYVGLEDLCFMDLPEHTVVDSEGNVVEKIREVALPDGNILSTHIGSSYKVMLHPASKSASRFVKQLTDFQMLFSLSEQLPNSCHSCLTRHLVI